MFETTASGVVKSITASKPARTGEVSAAALRFSSSPTTRTLWPRSRATSATRLPVLPRPNTRNSIVLPRRRFHGLYVPNRLGGGHIEDLRIGIAEELGVQRPDRLIRIILFDHETHVDFRGALRNHAHVYVPDGLKNPRCDPILAADVLTHHADQRLAPLVLPIRQLAEIGGNLGQLFIRIDGQRNRNLGGRNHVHRALVLVENVENRLQIAM